MNGWTPLDLVPGLWLLLLAFLLGRALGRWFDPVPARAWIVFGVVLVILFGPVLFLDNTLLPVGRINKFVPFRDIGLETVDDNRLQRDLTHAIMPWQAQVRRSLRQGEWPLWNPYSAAGQPLLANPQAMPFHPIVLAALPIPLPSAAGVMAALRVLVALVFTFLLLRRQRISEVPALGGALAYALGGFMILFLGWPHGNSTATLPVILYATVCWSETRRRRDLLLLTVSLFSIFASGHPETALYALLTAGIFALARIHAAAPRRWEVFRGWTVAALLAGFLASPFLLPAASYLPQTTRYNAMAARNESLAAKTFLTGMWEANLKTAPRRMTPIAAPNAYGNNRYGSYWGQQNINEDAVGFAGTLTLLAALLALAYRGGKRFPQELVFAVLAVVCLIVVFRPPGFIELTIRLPLFDKSPTFHRRVLMVLTFCLAYLAACTWERWRRHGLPRVRVGAIAVLLGAVLLWAYLAHPNPQDPAALAGLRHMSLAVQLAGLGIGAALLLRRRCGPPWALWTVACLVGAELLAFHGPANPPVPKRYFYPQSPPLSFLQERIVDNVDGYRMLGLHSALPPEFPTVYGLADPRAPGPSQDLGITRLMTPLRPKRGGFLFTKPHHPVLNLLGVRYVLAEDRWRLRAPLQEVFRGPNGVVWERPNPLPRFFLPRRTLVDVDGDWWQWTAENPSFGAQSLTSASPGHEGPWRASRLRGSALQPERLDATHSVTRASLVEERFMASGLYQDGGWRLLVDGRPRPATTANGPLFAAWLPAGEHRLDVLYRPPGFLLGVLSAAVAGALLLVFVLPPPRQVASQEAGGGQGDEDTEAMDRSGLDQQRAEGPG